MGSSPDVTVISLETASACPSERGSIKAMRDCTEGMLEHMGDERIVLNGPLRHTFADDHELDVNIRRARRPV